MAIYYMNVQVIGRSAGRSATGAAAYRAGERIHDERTGQTYDYTRRRGEIETEILAPEGAPEWVQDRAELWNRVEKGERRGDAQVAREIVVAFPKELNREEQRDLVRAYVQEQFVSRGMVADVAIHRSPDNPHAHILLTMREIGPEGFSAKKNRDWNKPEMLEQWREGWAVQANRALERAGREERIDHRSLAEQGSDRLPQVHLGPHAHALEKRGVGTEKGEHNRLVAEHNAVVIDLEKARAEKRDLEVKKTVTDRYSARLKAGWLVSHAQALGDLEYNLGGGALDVRRVRELSEQTRAEHQQVTREIQTIHREGERLNRAAEILADRQRAAADLQRLQAPMAAVKRWFSRDARDEFGRVQTRLEGLNDAAKRMGTATEVDFHDQQSRWQKATAKLPKLEEKASRLSRTLELAAQAIRGFSREQELERDDRDLRRRRREQARDTGRGR